MVKVYTASHKTNDILPIGTYHTLISKCSKIKEWAPCTIEHLKNTGTYFDIDSDSGLRLAIILLSYLKCTTIETSIWFKKGAINKDQIGNDVVDDIIKIRKELERELKALNLEASPEFKLLCPNCNCNCDDECFVLLTQYEDPESNREVFYPQKKRCGTTGESLKPSTYKGTCFGK